MVTQNITKSAEYHVLVTGCAGFIGFNVSKRLLELGLKVTGIDNLNDYYNVSLKEARLNLLKKYDKFIFHKADISEASVVNDLISEGKFDYVINLAAQAGVRYSIENPKAFIDSNITGFFNILEACRKHPVKRLIYASSSSVYGGSTNYPYSAEENVNKPVSLYAATKISNELMAHSYYSVYGLPSTGLRFFTVYGPWGRPDMAYYLFTDGIVKGKPINIYNHGEMERDYTYIDDIVDGITKVIEYRDSESYDIYNLGNNKPVKLMDFIGILEKSIGKKAIINSMDMQPGDVIKTAADISKSMEELKFNPSVPIEEGIAKFVDWYYEFNGLKR
ncbi:MAG: SDR family NAD(P)-dependent oxidoreductase [Clostridia bacterium]|nr:SDR family NAD(P)-dependent oxidoreductase [Clostridia bacterium]